MPEIDPIRELGRKLLRQGVPRRHAVRIVQELVEHRDDLEAEGRAAGHSLEAARSAASEKLGDIDELAEELLATRRRSYWCGRHPLISFVLLLLPAFLLLFIGFLLLFISSENKNCQQHGQNKSNNKCISWFNARAPTPPGDSFVLKCTGFLLLSHSFLFSYGQDGD